MESTLTCLKCGKNTNSMNDFCDRICESAALEKASFVKTTADYPSYEAAVRALPTFDDVKEGRARHVTSNMRNLLLERQKARAAEKMKVIENSRKANDLRMKSL